MSYPKSDIILYDGYCKLCNASLQFIIKHDHNNSFEYYAIQSKEAELLMSKMFAEKDIPNSVLLISDGKLYIKSEAFFRILPKMGRGYSLLSVFKIIPLKLRDKIYDWIAANRYKWFGKKDHCTLISGHTSPE